MKKQLILPSQYNHPESDVCYLRNKQAGYLGNSPIWWAKNGQGYTAYLEKAERFCPTLAEKIVSEDPDKWEAWPCSVIDNLSHRVFDAQDFRIVIDECEKYRVKK